MVTGAILIQARMGDSRAIAVLLTYCHDYLFHIALKRLPVKLQAKFDAYDLVQDTLLEVHRDFESFQGSSHAEFLAWIKSILLRNKANLVRHFRTAKRNTKKEVHFDDYCDKELMHASNLDPEWILITKENWHLLLAAIHRLPTEQSSIMNRRYFQGMTICAIAQETGKDVNVVRRMLSHGLDQLRNEFIEPSV